MANEPVVNAAVVGAVVVAAIALLVSFGVPNLLCGDHA